MRRRARTGDIAARHSAGTGSLRTAARALLPLDLDHLLHAADADDETDLLAREGAVERAGRGHVFRGYLGAGLQGVRQERASNESQSSDSRRGVLVVSIDPKGPSARAGILVGDIVTAWNGKPIERVREILPLLGPESVGNTIDLALIRGGAPTTLRVVIGERPVA